MITQAQLNNWFSYHSPAETAAAIGVSEAEVGAMYSAIRAAGKAFAEVVVRSTPASADQSVAVRLIREAVSSANAAIACGGQ